MTACFVLYFGVKAFCFDIWECMLEWVWFAGLRFWKVICICSLALDSLGDCCLLSTLLNGGDSSAILAGSPSDGFGLSDGDALDSLLGFRV